MSLSKYSSSICPCCDQLSLQPNGAFFICATCGLAITTQALMRAAKYARETARFDQQIVVSSN
jgi:hypothetical protein